MGKLVIVRADVMAKSHVSAYTKTDGTFVQAHEDKRAKHADLKPERLYSKMADADDRGGREAVHELAHDIIQHRPDLEEHVRREAADLGYSLSTEGGSSNKKAPEGDEHKATSKAAIGHEAVADQILEFIRQSPKAKFGLRVVAPDYDEYESLKPGSSLPNSKRWEDGDYTDVELPGTSTASIKENTKEGILEAIRLLGAHGKRGPNGYYYGDKVALVTGSVVRKKGQDVGERILSNARVVSLWKKPDTGMSEVQPNSSEKPMIKSIIIIRTDMVKA